MENELLGQIGDFLVQSKNSGWSGPLEFLSAMLKV